nr:retrotransposon protein, putative, unclassified [Tanacetum cinerariifolium]
MDLACPLGTCKLLHIRNDGKKRMVTGMLCVAHPKQLCNGCVVAKQTRQSLPNEAQRRASKPLELVHADLCGPITPQSTGGNRYFLLIVDYWCRYMWVYLLRSKDEALAKFKIFKAQVEMETAHKGEGIQRQTTTPYTPQQNSVVEWRNRTVVEMTRSMAEAVRHAVYLLNRLPTKAVRDITPYEGWKRRKPNLEYLKIFGCLAFVKKVGGYLTKLEDRSMPMVHLGMEPGRKAYRLYNLKSKRIVVARDVLFDEAKSWTWEATQGKQSPSSSSGSVPVNDTVPFDTFDDTPKGVDFEDAFAPVARMESIRLILASAAKENWIVHHLDVNYGDPPASAFSQGILTASYCDLLASAFSSCLPKFVDDTVTDYSRRTPSIDTSNSVTSDLQSNNSSVSELGESSGSIMSKPMIKFVKVADCPKVTKTNNIENARKSTVRYAEMYRNTTKSPKARVNTTRPKAVINVVRTNRVNDVTASACWVWKPIKPNSASITLKRYDYVDVRGRTSKSRSIIQRITMAPPSLAPTAPQNDGVVEDPQNQVTDSSSSLATVMQKQNGLGDLATAGTGDSLPGLTTARTEIHVDECVFPPAVEWRTSASKDGMPVSGTYSVEAVRVLDTHPTVTLFESKKETEFGGLSLLVLLLAMDYLVGSSLTGSGNSLEHFIALTVAKYTSSGNSITGSGKMH